MASRRGAAAPLALAAAPHASAFEARFENDAVDALPYADVLPEGWRDAVDALVRDEARVLRGRLLRADATRARRRCARALMRAGAPLRRSLGRCDAARRPWRTTWRSCLPPRR